MTKQIRPAMCVNIIQGKKKLIFKKTVKHFLITMNYFNLIFEIQNFYLIFAWIIVVRF